MRNGFATKKLVRRAVGALFSVLTIISARQNATASTPSDAVAPEIITAGVYQGKNLYVQNPLSDDNTGFCTKSVYVNDILVIENPRTSAYEINLSFLNLHDSLEIRIAHKPDCAPKIINPQVIKGKSQFGFLSIVLEEDLVKWHTTGEKAPGKFFVEQFLNDKWVIMHAEEAGQRFDFNSYEANVQHEEGFNHYRIKYLPEEGNTHYSKVLEYFSVQEPVTFSATSGDTITLSRETDFEVLDSTGSIIFSGEGKEIPIENLAAGVYYLNIDNRTERFHKK